MAKKDDGKQSCVTMAVKIAVVVLGAMVAGGASLSHTLERNVFLHFYKRLGDNMTRKEPELQIQQQIYIHFQCVHFT